MTRLTLAPSACRERMTSALDAAIERTQDFTDSAYTSHEHRENILLLWDRVRSGLSHVIRAGINLVCRLDTVIRTKFLSNLVYEIKIKIKSATINSSLNLHLILNSHRNKERGTRQPKSWKLLSEHYCSALKSCDSN
jgi:hypothetical protein